MELLVVIILYVLLYSTTFNCNIKSSSISLKIQPPPIVFSLVWPIIFGLLWYSSQYDNNKNNDYLYYLLLSSFILWPILYGCNNKTYGIYSILLSMIILGLIFTEELTPISYKCLIPVLVWLNFALILNCFVVQLE
jgi:tryptophan-rich sensory protein